MIRRLFRDLLLGASVAAACVGPLFAQTADAPTAQASSSAVEPARLGDYRLGSSDKIRVLVFNEPDLSGEFTVNSDGTLSYPLIGSVAVAGHTTSEVRDMLEQRLAGGYLKTPQVSIDVIEFRPYFIFGEVNKPGNYPYTADLTVMKAVATANGFTYRADQKHVYLRHEGQSQETKYEVTSDLPLKPGDTIRIGERYF